MRKACVVVWAFVLLCCLPARHAFAAEWIECDGCDFTAAHQRALAGQAPSTRLIFDASPKSLFKFEIYKEMTGPGCSPESIDPGKGGEKGHEGFGCWSHNVAILAAVTQDEEQFFNELSDYYLAEPQGWEKSLNVDAGQIGIGYFEHGVDPTGAMSAFDVVNSQVARARVRQAAFDYINSFSVLSNIGGLSGQAFNILLLGGDMAINVIVTFSDGTTVVVTFDDASPTGHIDDSRARAHLYDVISQSNSGTWLGGFVFGSSHMAQNFLNQAERLGIRVERSGSASNVVECAFKNVCDPSGNCVLVLSCKIIGE